MNKTKSISARLTETEHSEIRKLAEKNSMKLSDYIVHSCLQHTKSEFSQNATLIDIKKSLDKLEKGFIKKKEFIEKSKEILKGNGIY